MSVLVTYGSKRGGTKGLAEMVATDLREEGLQVDLVPPNRVKRLDEHEAVVVGGALYAQCQGDESVRGAVDASW